MSDIDPVDPALARLLDDPAVWAEVSSDLRASTLAGALGAPVTELRARPGRSWQRPVLLAAAALVVVGLAVVGATRLGGEADPADAEVALAGTENAPGATATAELRDEPAGVSVVLQVDGLPPAPEGTFYEAWLVGPTGKVSAGTFHQRGEQDEIKLWLGVDPAGYEAITVTRQPIEGGTLAEGVPVLRGEIETVDGL